MAGSSASSAAPNKPRSSGPISRPRTRNSRESSAIASGSSSSMRRAAEVDVLQLVLAKLNDVAMLEPMPKVHALFVHEQTVRTVHVFQHTRVIGRDNPA